MSDKYSWQKRDRERKEAKIKKQLKGLPRRSKKLAANERIYAVLAKDFLLDHPVCQCGHVGCRGVATEVHHKKGRGKWLNVVEFFLAVCHVCHRYIETHPEWAKANGYSLNRNE